LPALPGFLFWAVDTSVIAGLDPAIHANRQQVPNFIMDARVKPGQDEFLCFWKAAQCIADMTREPGDPLL
jgi:hypothetical protein